MTFLRARQPDPIPDAEGFADFYLRVANGTAREDVPGVLGYAVAHTLNGRTGLTHTTPLPWDEAAHELRQCHHGCCRLIELRKVSHGRLT